MCLVYCRLKFLSKKSNKVAIVRNILSSIFAAFIVVLTACGGGGGGGGSNSTPAFSDSSTAANTHPIAVNGGPLGIQNLAFTSVTICVPGTTQCRIVDHVIVDTGSIGLRLVSSAANALSLPAQLAPNSDPLFACAEFVDGSYAWGSVRRADVKLGTYTASDISIQIIGDGAPNLPPADCGTGEIDDNLADIANMGGNGIIGVGYLRQDCGLDCTFIASADGYYFACGNSCVPSIVSIEAQIKNPIALFPSDNNGVIIDLPSIPNSGAASVSGFMIFGIDTRANNSLRGKTVFTTSDWGLITTRYKDIDYPYSFIDSGSNGLFIPDDSIPSCTISTDFYCPSNTLTLNATIIGVNNSNQNISFKVANTESLNGNLNAFNNLAGYLSDTFDWGLPFFYGRKVYTGFETNPQGPYAAF